MILWRKRLAGGLRGICLSDKINPLNIRLFLDLEPACLSRLIRRQAVCETRPIALGGDAKLLNTSSHPFRFSGVTGETMRLDTLSGDINLDGSCTSVWCKSMSGDVEVDVETAQLTLTSTSGDIMVSGKAKEISSKTVSGEIQMEMLDGSQLDLLHAESRSGDISIHLPQPGNYTVEMTSRSGDTRSKVPAPRSGEKTAQVFAKTMSGDIVVR